MQHPPLSPWWEPEQESERYLPEGPRFLQTESQPCVAWVNIQTSPEAVSGNICLRTWNGPTLTVYQLDRRPGFLLPTTDPNHLLVGMEHQVGMFDIRTNNFQPLATIPSPHAREIINDAEVHPSGKAIIFGTKDTAFREDVARLFLYTTEDQAITPLLGGQTCSNGKVIFPLSPDLLFDIDTPTHQVKRYRLDLSQRTLTFEDVVLDLADRDDFPDGMIGLDDGTVLIAMYHPGDVADGQILHASLETSKILGTIAVPGSPRVTCPLIFDTPQGRQLLATTATEGMPNALRMRAIYAGCLMRSPTHLMPLPEVLVQTH